MAYVTVKVEYQEYIMPAKDALTFVELLTRAKKYDKRYNPEVSGYNHYIYDNTNEYEMKVISDDLYNMASLAGKPE